MTMTWGIGPGERPSPSLSGCVDACRMSGTLRVYEGSNKVAMLSASPLTMAAASHAAAGAAAVSRPM